MDVVFEPDKEEWTNFCLNTSRFETFNETDIKEDVLFWDNEKDNEEVDGGKDKKRKRKSRSQKKKKFNMKIQM